jgi:hypothetical protein
MLRIINLILVFAVLTTQSAWAINSSNLHQGDAEQTYAHAAEQHDESAEACSHLNHAGAHFIGIFSNISIDILNTSNQHVIQLKKFASSISYQPPTPPNI